MDDVKRILVVSRSTKHCQKAVHYGISLSQGYGADLYVLHLIYDPFGIEGWNLPMLHMQSVREEYKKIQQDAKSVLDKIINAERARGLIIKEFVKVGKPVDEILMVIEEEKIDLAIMLAHKEGLLEHFLFSRDHEEILRKMPCSILFVKQEIP
jgi:universal stress protein A